MDVSRYLGRQLAYQADQAFLGPAWHGPSLMPTLRKVKAAEAKPPSAEGYTIWGVALHTAYWKHRGLLLLAKASGGAVAAPGRFARSPADWPSLPATTSPKAWSTDLEFLVETHLKWVESLALFPWDRWHESVRKDGLTAANLVFGVASHDLYHTAQIRNFGVKAF